MRTSLLLAATTAIPLLFGCVFIRDAGLCRLPEHDLRDKSSEPPLWIRSKIYVPRDGLDPTLVGLASHLFLISFDASMGGPSMRAYNTLTGEELWRQPAELGDSLLTTDNAVYKGGVDEIAEYDPNTGHRLRVVQTPSVGLIYLTNWAGKDIFAVTPGSGHYLIFDIATGKVDISAPLLPYDPLAIENDVLYFADAEGFRAKDNRTGNILWTYPVHEQITLHALFTPDAVILRASSGNIYAIRKATGGLVWKLTNSLSISNLAQDETRLYFLTAEGDLEIIDKRTGQEIQRLPLSSTRLVLEPPEARIGSYDVWVDIPDQVLVGSLGDSCQLFAVRLPK